MCLAQSVNNSACNHSYQIIVDIFGALSTLSLSILKLNDQYEEGAGVVSNIRVTMIRTKV